MLVGLAGCRDQNPPAAPSPIEVVTLRVAPQTVPVTYSFVAQAESSHQVEIVARVNGFLEKILYREGDVVKAGQVLFVMDPKPFQAQVAAARGELANREAQLWTSQANLDRIRPLAELDAASKSDLDNAQGAVKAAQAAVFEARARLDKAELDLGYATIKSPVKGVSGKALMREGAYLAGVGDASLLTYVAALDPIWIDFSVSQNQMASLRLEAQEGRLIVPDENAYEVDIDLSDGTHYPHSGKLSFADPSFNPDTGTFLVRAELPNPDGALRPGMFVKALVKGAVRPDALVVPQKAVQQTSNGHVVFVVGEGEKAELRPVAVGNWVGSDWIVNQGLQAGDRVVVEGFQRLAPGTPVRVVNSAARGSTSAEPQPPAPPAAAGQ